MTSDPSTWDLVAQLGLAGALGGVAGNFINGLSARRRDRDASRRDRVEAALTEFYSPVTVRLEMEHRWNELMRQREMAQAASEKFPSTHDKMLWKLVGANVRIRRELTSIIEANLHHVDDPKLQDSALEYLAESHVNEWQRKIVMGDVDEPGRGIVLMGGTEEQSQFHRLVKARCDELGREFRDLSGPPGRRRRRQ